METKRWKHLLASGEYCFFEETDIKNLKHNDDGSYTCLCGSNFTLEEICFVGDEPEENPYALVLDDVYQVGLLKVPE